MKRNLALQKLKDELDRLAGKPDNMPEGYNWCIVCKKRYKPIYSNLEEAKKHNALPFEKEQHVSGICSDKCWTRLFQTTTH